MIHLLSYKRLIRTAVFLAIIIANVAQAATTQIRPAAIIAECVFTNESSTYSAGTLQTFAANGTTAAGIRLTPAGTTGSPASGTHGAGELHVDSLGVLYICSSSGTPGTWAAAGAGGTGTLTTIQEGGTTVSAVATILDFDGPAFSTTLVGTTVRVSPTFGTTSGTFTEGSDTRHNPAPSGAGKLVYDNGSAYVAASAGTSTTVLHGGSAPSFSAIVSADITNGTVSVLDVTSDVSSRLFPPGAVTGDTPYHNGSDWQRLTIGSSAQVSQVNGSSLPTWVTISGDATIAVGGSLTIAANAIGSSEITDGTVTQLDVTSDVSNRLNAPGGVSGDISYSDGINWLRLAKGAVSTVLQVSSGGTLQYSTVTEAMLASAVSVKFPPTPSGAGKIIYDNGSAYVAATAGSTSQVLIGGTTPAFGNVPLAAGQEVWALADLSDVTSKSGTGTVVIMQATPTIATPVLTNPTISNTVTWTDNADAANSTGTQVRNGAALEYHDGTASRELVAKLRAETEASGDLLTHNGTTWLSLVKGSNSTVLNVSSGGVLGYSTITSEMIANGVVSTLDVTTDVSSRLFPSGAVQGDIVYFNGTDWQRLAAGNSGEFLKTLGTGANPLWAAVGGTFSGNQADTTLGYFTNLGATYGGDVYINDGLGLTGTLNVTGTGVFTSTLTASRALVSGTGSTSAPDFADSADLDTGLGIGSGATRLFLGIDGVATPVVRIGDTSNHRVDITAGTGATDKQALHVSGTIGAASNGYPFVYFEPTGSGSGAVVQIGYGCDLLAGYTGSASNFAQTGYNYTVSTGSLPYIFGPNGAAVGARFDSYTTSASASGTRIGVQGIAESNTSATGIAIGGVFASVTAATSHRDVGAYLVARNTSGGGQTGAYIGMAKTGGISAVGPTLTDAALQLNNEDQAVPIFVAQDNGSDIFTIGDGGLLTATAGVSITGGGLTTVGQTTLTCGAGASAGTPGAGLIITATAPAYAGSYEDTSSAISEVITGKGVASQALTGHRITLSGGTAPSVWSYGLNVKNSIISSAASLGYSDANFYTRATVGIKSQGDGTAAGAAIGLVGVGGDSATSSVGVYGVPGINGSVTVPTIGVLGTGNTANWAHTIGVVGLGGTTYAGYSRVAGAFFSTGNPTAVSTDRLALLVDNRSSTATEDVAVFRDNGVNVYKIDGNGGHTFTNNVTLTAQAPANFTEGTLIANSTQKTFSGMTGNVTQSFVGTLFTTTADVTTTANSTSQFSLIGPSTGVTQTAANGWAAGKTIHIHHQAALYGDAGTPGNAVFDIKLGSTVLGRATIPIPASASNIPVVIDADVTCVSTGATGAFRCIGTATSVITVATGAASIFRLTDITSVVDTTAAKVIDIQANTDTANANNFIAGRYTDAMVKN